MWKKYRKVLFYHFSPDDSEIIILNRIFFQFIIYLFSIRLYYEFVSSSDSLFQFARIKEEINELGLEDLEQNVSEDQINQMKGE